VHRAKPGILTESMLNVSMRNMHVEGLTGSAGKTRSDADETKTSNIRRKYDPNPRTALRRPNDVLTIATHSRLPIRG
jgi:hypothetical protein